MQAGAGQSKPFSFAPSSGGMFGQASAPSLFGQSPPGGNLFGSTPSGGGLFGQSTPAGGGGGMFGSSPAPFSGGNMFGPQSQPAPFMGGSLFGGGAFGGQQQPQQQPQQQQQQNALALMQAPGRQCCGVMHSSSVYLLTSQIGPQRQ